MMLVLLFVPGFARSQVHPATLQEWRDLKYSMFIHFGVYSHLGGLWEGKEVSKGLSEQIQAHAGIYSDVYSDVAKQFNPVKWNPDSIAMLARAAGMGSIVITSKHHDGFAMFNSAHTDFDIVDATPYKKDIVAELAAASKRHGLKFGLYFSLIDWHYAQASPISSHNSDRITPEHHDFNKKQISELLSNYGPISELWFDMGSMSLEQSKEMRDLVHQLQPNCMIGSRIGNDMGDFTVMGDNQEPNYIIGVPWQSPASFFHETWGYRSWQKRENADAKFREKLESLIRVVSRGGNYLLNIGPRGDGTVLEYEKDVLLRIGKWLSKNGEAIYNTMPDPFQVQFPWGSITSRKNKLYMHVLDFPSEEKITLPGLKGKVARCFVLGENTSCQVQKTEQGIVIQLPPSAKGRVEFRVIVLEFSDDFSVLPLSVFEADERIALNSNNAFKYFSNSGIDYSTRYTSTIKESWTLKSKKNLVLSAKLIFSEEEKGKTIDLDINGAKQIVLLDGEPFSMENNIQSLTMQPVYIQGPMWSSIEGSEGEIGQIDLAKPWPDNNGKLWTIADEGNDSEVFLFPAGLNTAYYCFQQIESANKQRILVRITSGDALVVWINGVEKYIHNNPFKHERINHFLVLDLERGKNQLVVKLFNHFHKAIPFRIDYAIPQVLYRKKLADIQLKKDALFPVSWKLHAPFTPHEDMGIPNLELVLRKNDTPK